ncbi:MAG: hypothetical protein K0R28_5652, partial [Paenibacillus sp.]|nr:hypothetical protein [Paenibacillus sp.]
MEKSQIVKIVSEYHYMFRVY